MIKLPLSSSYDINGVKSIKLNIVCILRIISKSFYACRVYI